MSSGPKAAPKYYKSCLQITPKHYFGPPYLRPWAPRDIETLVVSWGRPYQSNDYDMGSFADFRSVRACHTYAAVHVKVM